MVNNRLFQPFVQTHVGKKSGKGRLNETYLSSVIHSYSPSGSGLGLAIVRQIVTLSGGRLGLKSQKGSGQSTKYYLDRSYVDCLTAGATFWVELAYPIATSQQIDNERNGEHSPLENLPILVPGPEISLGTSRTPTADISLRTPPARMGSSEIHLSALSLADARQLQIGASTIPGRPILVHRASSSTATGAGTLSTPSSTAPLLGNNSKTLTLADPDYALSAEPSFLTPENGPILTSNASPPLIQHKKLGNVHYLKYIVNAFAFRRSFADTCSR